MSNPNIFPHKVLLPYKHLISIVEMSQWCKTQGWQNAIDYTWRLHDGGVYFYFDQEDAVSWFKMRWE